jgi:hypothetical protein
LAQAGDATGLLPVLPLADFFPRRKFTLTLIALSALFWYDMNAYISIYLRTGIMFKSLTVHHYSHALIRVSRDIDAKVLAISSFWPWSLDASAATTEAWIMT